MKETQAPLLEIKNLTAQFITDNTPATAVNAISFSIMEDEVLGVVGESGSGKSVTALSILRLIPDPPGKITAETVSYRGRNLIDMSIDQMRDIRGRHISMIFQEPMTSLNPVFTIGDQVAEAILQHRNVTRAAALSESAEVLTQVGIPDAAKRLNNFPYQFSGGMRQRVMIAMALACNPSLLIADEPTTALDVTIQAQILDLMIDLKTKKKGSSIMLITHDLGVIAEYATRVIVMYGGRIQEKARVGDLFADPLHPYTQGLLKAIPSIATKKRRLYTIPGTVPHIKKMPSGCPFHPRCPERMNMCDKVVPDLYAVKGREVRCHLYNKDVIK